MVIVGGLSTRSSPKRGGGRRVEMIAAFVLFMCFVDGDAFGAVLVCFW